MTFIGGLNPHFYITLERIKHIYVLTSSHLFHRAIEDDRMYQENRLYRSRFGKATYHLIPIC